MFDDQPVSGLKPPSNLPTEDPADMFEAVDKQPSFDNGPVSGGQPSALDRGVLKPKTNPVAPPVNYNVPPNMPDNGSLNNGQDVYTVKEPSFTRGLMTVLVVVLLGGILGGGGWWLYNKFVKNSMAVSPSGENMEVVDENVPVEENVVEENLPVIEDGTVGLAEEDIPTDEVVGDVTDSQVLFGEPIDKDADGLDDNKELELGTDPNNWDSDLDELSDGDEVLVWKTDPLNSDTDGDKYKDGSEVKNGYNPNGPGKIFEPPKEEKK